MEVENPLIIRNIKSISICVMLESKLSSTLLYALLGATSSSNSSMNRFLVSSLTGLISMQFSCDYRMVVNIKQFDFKRIILLQIMSVHVGMVTIRHAWSSNAEFYLCITFSVLSWFSDFSCFVTILIFVESIITILIFCTNIMNTFSDPI